MNRHLFCPRREIQIDSFSSLLADPKFENSKSPKFLLTPGAEMTQPPETEILHNILFSKDIGFRTRIGLWSERCGEKGPNGEEKAPERGRKVRVENGPPGCECGQHPLITRKKRNPSSGGFSSERRVFVFDLVKAVAWFRHSGESRSPVFCLLEPFSGPRRTPG